MISIDTNILARYYVDDPRDPEAARQRPVAERVLRDTDALFVPVSVVLELVWVLTAFYNFGAKDTAQVLEHLTGLPNVTVEDWPLVLETARLHRGGLDFADALHLTRSNRCQQLYTFDDRKFARRAKKMNLTPSVEVPA